MGDFFMNRHTPMWATRAAGAGILLAIAGALAACGPSVPPRASEPGILFRDDFAQTTSGWDSHSGADLTTDYVDGRYLIAVEEPGVDVWARPGLTLTDVVFEAETQYAAGPANNEYGLICRYERRGDGRNSFYFFFVSSDGYYALGKVVGDVRTILNPEVGSFQPSDAIRLEPEATNTLTATCDGDRLALEVNGVQVGAFTDGELRRGDIGLIAGTFDEGGVRIHFDNVVVREPG
jgi:hypothetical protein